jgi:hypothetical protein
MKTYIAGETKKQRQERKSRQKGSQQTVVNPLPAAPSVTSNSNRYVVCLKYGNKYSSEYVNKLYSMVKRNLTLNYEFVCFTEDATDIDPKIRIESIPMISGVTGWWYKPMFFNPNLVLKGTILFFDLDVVVFKNIDKLFTYEPNKFCIIRDFNRTFVRNYNKFNSSIFRLNTGMHRAVYTDFMKDPKSPMRRYHGDQDWIRAMIKDGEYVYWPEEWIESYKWEMRGRPKYNKMPRGERDFEINGNPVIKDATSVAVFHGDPNPHNCKDQWVIDHWKI